MRLLPYQDSGLRPYRRCSVCETRWHSVLGGRRNGEDALAILTYYLDTTLFT
jgi:formate dehydrogenase maturation protein FdhE